MILLHLVIRTRGKPFQLEPNGKLKILATKKKILVPNDAITWDIGSQSWKKVGANQEATSKVTFDLILGNWHHEQKMDMNDILHSMYFLLEWGSETA